MLRESLFVSPDRYSQNGFGREVVAAQLVNDPTFNEAEKLSELREELDETALLVILDLLSSARRSPWLRTILFAMGSEQKIPDLFTADTIHEPFVPDVTFSNLLQIHHFRLAEQSRELKPQFETHITNFCEHVEELVADGTLPTIVLKKLQAISHIEFAVGDTYNTYDIHGFCERSDDSSGFDVVVAPTMIKDGMLSKETVFHELVHGISADARDSIRNLLNNILPDDRMTNDITNDLEEALTEHIAQVILGERDVEKVQIESNEDSYLDVRPFFIAMKNAGSGDFSMQTLVRTYFGADVTDTEVDSLKTLLACAEPSLLSDYFSVGDTAHYDRTDELNAELFGFASTDELSHQCD